MELRCLLLILAGVFLATSSSADEVTPVDEVVSGVVVRDIPSSSDSRRLGKLLPGERATIQESVPYWYRIALPDGVAGYVSKRWVRIVASSSIVVTPTVGTPFQLHVVDVGIGDGFLLDMEQREILVDGGMNSKPMVDYMASRQLISSPIELAIVTHADADHWKGMEALLGLNSPSPAFQILEFWEPGYDRSCRSLPTYDAFVNRMRQVVPTVGFKRPLEFTHVPSAASGVITPIDLPSIPGVRLTLLHSEQQPDGPDCAFQINNASIVLRVEVGGVVMLWTGDINGKLREHASSVTPAFIEQKLLSIEAQHPGILKADLLKVAHHGSETASTDAFIAAVAPRFALISASTNHHLPRETVVQRYEQSGAIVLRTDVSRQAGDDAILCVGSGAGELDCNYADIFEL